MLNSSSNTFVRLGTDSVSAENDTRSVELGLNTGFEIRNIIAEEERITTINTESEQIGNVTLLTPAKPTGNYTLATLDDIKKINLSGRIYANNAAAITGGLTVNDVYKTSTGELRIVV